MKKITIGIDCDGIYCGQCRHKEKGDDSTDFCMVHESAEFPKTNQLLEEDYIGVEVYRCQQCLDAEIKGECVKVEQQEKSCDKCEFDEKTCPARQDFVRGLITFSDLQKKIQMCNCYAPKQPSHDEDEEISKLCYSISRKIKAHYAKISFRKQITALEKRIAEMEIGEVRFDEIEERFGAIEQRVKKLESKPGDCLLGGAKMEGK